MTFEDTVTSFYYKNYAIISVDDYILPLIINWTIFKFLFYIVPIMELMHSHDRENELNREVRISGTWRFLRGWSIWMILVPLVDCFVFFYLVVSLIGKVDGLYPGTKSNCQIHGLAAGIINVIVLYVVHDALSTSNYFLVISEMCFHIYLTLSVVLSWILISSRHLFYIIDWLMKLGGRSRILRFIPTMTAAKSHSLRSIYDQGRWCELFNYGFRQR